MDKDELLKMVRDLENKAAAVRCAQDALDEARYEVVKYLADRRHYYLLDLKLSRIRRAAHS